MFGAYFGEEHGGSMPSAIVALRPFRDLVVSLAGTLTYVVTAAFAASLARAQWLGRRASLAYIIVSVIASCVIVIEILEHPDAAAASQPWYTVPGFVLGVPALPLIMPSLLGVVLLRRAGDEEL